MKCHWSIPRTYYHLSPAGNKLIDKLVSLHVPVEKAAAYFFYKNDNPYGQLLRDAKYNGRPEINRQLSRHFARELKADGFFDDIDLIIPVPLHWLKRLRRGYNQTEYIASGLAEISGLPVCFNLKAIRGHATQTRKHGRERRRALEGIFQVDDAGELAGKHILLVDDVITTGSTILTCAETLYKAVMESDATQAATCRISILSLATTRLA